MKKLLFFIVLLVVSLTSFGQPKLVVQKKTTYVQRVGDYVRFITPEVIDSTICNPPDPKCNYIHRYERLKYDEYLLKNKSGIFVPDTVMILAYKSRYKEEIFSFGEKLNGIEFFGFFKQKTEVIKTNIVFIDKEILIQQDLYPEVKFSWFYVAYLFCLFLLSLSFFEVVGVGEFNLGRVLFFGLIISLIIFQTIVPHIAYFTLESNVFFLLFQLVISLIWIFIRATSDGNHLYKACYIISLVIVSFAYFFIPFSILLSILLLLPISFFLLKKYTRERKFSL